jgi:hypothetical protein
MRKPLLVFAALLMTAGAVFADWGVGGAAFRTFPALFGQQADTINVGSSSVSQYGIGGDVRLKVGLFQAEAVLLYSTGNSFDAYLDAGVALDVSVFRLSFGAGQSFTSINGENASLRVGLNAKAGAQVMWGTMSIGISCIMPLDGSSSWPVGLSMVFWR